MTAGDPVPPRSTAVATEDKPGTRPASTSAPRPRRRRRARSARGPPPRARPPREGRRHDLASRVRRAVLLHGRADGAEHDALVIDRPPKRRAAQRLGVQRSCRCGAVPGAAGAVDDDLQAKVRQARGHVNDRPCRGSPGDPVQQDHCSGPPVGKGPAVRGSGGRRFGTRGVRLDRRHVRKAAQAVHGRPRLFERRGDPLGVDRR